MRKELLELLQCPVCRQEKLELIVLAETDIEIRRGHIKCLECHNVFGVEEGIPHLLITPSQEIINEQVGWTRLEKAVVNTDELMLSLPDAIGEHKEAWQGQAANFHYMWSQLQLAGNERVLDLGSGRCWTTRFFSMQGCYTVGIDILLTKYVGLLTSDIYIRNEGTYFERVLGDMNDLPFRPEVFDLVFVAATLHHSSDLHTTVRQIERTLKPGGRLVVVNEPAVSIFQNRKIENSPEIEAGVNEHVFWFWEYLVALRRASMHYQLHPFIGSYNPYIDRINYAFKQKYPKQTSTRIVVSPLVTAQLILFGGVVNIIAEKPDRDDRRSRRR